MRSSGRRVLRFSRCEPHQHRQPGSSRHPAQPGESRNRSRDRLWSRRTKSSAVFFLDFNRDHRSRSRFTSPPTLMKDEFDFIRALRERAAVSSSVTGIGDDAAVFQVATGKQTVITTDLLIEDIDFRRTTIPPYLLGHKALAVSLSDIAAMGARPRWALISIGIPNDVWQTDFRRSLLRGMVRAGEPLRRAVDRRRHIAHGRKDRRLTRSCSANAPRTRR